MKKEENLKDLLAKLNHLEQLVETLSRGKYMWESTFDAIGDPVMIIDDHYAIQRANLAAADRAGHDIREMIGRHCYESFAGRDDICPLCPLQSTLKRSQPSNIWIDNLMEARDFQVSSYPYEDSVSEKKAVVHHYREVTEEKRLHRKLLQSEKMAAVGMLAGGVAHEINNPLAGILAFAQLIKKELDKGNPISDDISEIENAALRCKDIVQSLLEFSRQSHESETSEVSVNSMIEKILPLIRLRLRSQQIELKTELDDRGPCVVGSATRLQQVILNLLTNAAQAIGKNGTIRVSTKLDKNTHMAIIQLEDSGCGILAEDVGRIFDPFFTTKEAGDGTGLGLSISYSIISEHGGHIDVHSEVDKGSIFTISLPAKSEPASEAVEGAS
jgi:PAS domain S-box-containing protein